MSDMSDRGAVRATLQHGYGDATQTVLDDRVAGDVISTLRERGWFSAQQVAAIVLAAGGSVTVPDNLLARLDELELSVAEDYMSRGRKLIARQLCSGRDPAYPGTCQMSKGHPGGCFNDPHTDA